MSDEEVRTCVSCKHFQGPVNDYVMQLQRQQPKPECKHPKAATRDPIYGKAYCENERSIGRGCGKKGKYWETKESK